MRVNFNYLCITIKRNTNNKNKMRMSKFRLSDSFIAKYEDKDPNFGFGGLGEMVYLRTYSRIKKNGEKEKWFETVRRVTEWTFETQRQHINKNGLGWSNKKAQKTAKEFYDRIFTMKFLPPGRGLWIAGTEALDNKPIAAALNNCAFYSTKDLDKDPTAPFEFLMDMSMLGVGVGFDTDGAKKLQILTPDNPREKFVIPDSREGWVEALEKTISPFFKKDRLLYDMDYSLIRSNGALIKGFGGTASGYEPLKTLLLSIIDQFSHRGGELISVADIVDVMNKIGVCVVAGNVRRSAELALGEYNDSEFLGLKDYRWDPKTNSYVGAKAYRSKHGYASNNSIFAKLGMDYTKVGAQIAKNGEPGLFWLENAQDYSRMCDLPDYKDKKAKGANPCVEQTLESGELCCLVETFPTRNDDIEDYLRTLKFAYLYAKTVTLCNTHWAETNRVMLRNRRIGTSMSGIAQIYDTKGIGYLKELCERGYVELKRLDDVYSDWLCIPKSIKMTSVKPSGTVSLLAGCTPGIHFPESTHYKRRMRIAADSEMIAPLIEAGFKIEPELNDSANTLIVEVPVKVEGVRKVSDVSMWEQLNIAAFMQEHWADNQVSATITFDPKTEGSQIANALNVFQYKLKGVSFFPSIDTGVFHQMPYESISKEKYDELAARVKPIKWGTKGEAAEGERFCSNDTCTIK